jgi:hypothetical protein
MVGNLLTANSRLASAKIGERKKGCVPSAFGQLGSPTKRRSVPNQAGFHLSGFASSFRATCTHHASDYSACHAAHPDHLLCLLFPRAWSGSQGPAARRHATTHFSTYESTNDAPLLPRLVPELFYNFAPLFPLSFPCLIPFDSDKNKFSSSCLRAVSSLLRSYLLHQSRKSKPRTFSSTLPLVHLSPSEKT